MNSLPLGQRALTFQRFMQQRLDVCLVRQALGFGEPLRERDVSAQGVQAPFALD